MMAWPWLSDPDDYDDGAGEYQLNERSAVPRRIADALAAKAYAHTASYDTAITKVPVAVAGSTMRWANAILHSGQPLVERIAVR